MEGRLWEAATAVCSFSIFMPACAWISAISWVLLQRSWDFCRPIIGGQQLFPRGDGSICKDGGDCVSNKHRCTVTIVSTPTSQSRALDSERLLSQSVPSRCVSADKGSVKYYNKQNRKVVLACQHLPFFNSVCRPLAGMENFSLKQKTLLFLSSSMIEERECKVNHSRSTTVKVSPVWKPRWCV